MTERKREREKKISTNRYPPPWTSRAKRDQPEFLKINFWFVTATCQTVVTFVCGFQLWLVHLIFVCLVHWTSKCFCVYNYSRTAFFYCRNWFSAEINEKLYQTLKPIKRRIEKNQDKRETQCRWELDWTGCWFLYHLSIFLSIPA